MRIVGDQQRGALQRDRTGERVAKALEPPFLTGDIAPRPVVGRTRSSGGLAPRAAPSTLARQGGASSRRGTRPAALKDQALDATKRSDSEFYQRYCAEDSLAIVPFGIFDKAQVVEQMSQPDPPLRSSAINDVQAIAFTANCGLVTYRASYPSGDMLVSTLYLKRECTSQGVVYQQTPDRHP